MEDTTRLRALPTLGEIMEHQGRTNSWLAGHLGISRSMASLTVRGIRPVTLTRARVIANLVGVPIALIFEGMTDA